jgi:hypothetical protein
VWHHQHHMGDNGTLYKHFRTMLVDDDGDTFNLSQM